MTLIYIVLYSYSPHEAWREALDARKQALARRQYIDNEKWQEPTKNLPALQKGDSVYVQNVVGNHPRRWERTGTEVECKEYDQYNVKIDGSGRCTLRNSKHLRIFHHHREIFSNSNPKSMCGGASYGT